MDLLSLENALPHFLEYENMCKFIPKEVAVDATYNR